MVSFIVDLVCISCIPDCAPCSWVGVEESVGNVPVDTIDVVALLAFLKVVSAFWLFQSFSKIFRKIVDCYLGFFKPVEWVPRP